MIETGKDIREKIEITLQTIRPYLNADGGDVEFVDVTPEMTVKLRLLGACSTCDISRFTMKAGIEESLKKAIPSIKSVVAV
ncbi:MAG: NifU family protein [Bacteroidetes bacterium]|nr:NifU family protein [Bacteroidota bacterium]